MPSLSTPFLPHLLIVRRRSAPPLYTTVGTEYFMQLRYNSVHFHYSNLPLLEMAEEKIKVRFLQFNRYRPRSVLLMHMKLDVLNF